MSSIQNLELYYEFVYPYQTIVQWLTYNSTRPLNHRQFSFEYEGGSVQRYVVFTNADSMRERMTSRFEQRPNKVDAGAIWSQIPKKDQPGRTIQRQLIFDFDMNDYDDVRNCCQGKKVCLKCWKLLIVAIQIVTKTLEEDFDCYQFMYVFSGGRGVHIWVCDQRARKMKDSVRKALVDYLQLVHGNDKAQSLIGENVIRPVDKILIPKSQNINLSIKKDIKNYYIKKVFPHLVGRSLQIIEKQNFLQIFKQQTALQHEKGRKIVQKILRSRSDKLHNRVIQRWQKCQNKTQLLYQILLQQIDLFQQCILINKIPSHYPPKQVFNKKYQNITFIQQQIMLSFLYPRMDYNVSTNQNHLLKLPFSIHPTSHKVSVPIFKESLRDFDPACNDVKFQYLINQLEALRKEEEKQGIELTRQKAIDNTPIRHYIMAMKQFTKSCK